MTYRNPEEKRLAKFLELSDIPFTYEEDKLKYTLPASKHTYCPDFKVQKKDGSYMYLEYKGGPQRHMPHSGLSVNCRRKMVAVRAQNADLDVRFVFSNAKLKVTPKGVTYGEWATINEFKWCEQTLPDSWLAEMRHS